MALRHNAAVNRPGIDPAFRRLAAEERAHRHRAALEARKAMAERGEVPLYDLRAAKVPDLRVITDAWMASFKFSPFVQGIPSEVYRIEQRDRVRRLVTRSKVLCAVDPEDHDRVVGWMAFQPPRGPGKHVILHYISVHPSLQNLGLGTALCRAARKTSENPDAPIFITHFTFPMRRVMARWNLIYNPFLLEVRPDDYP